MTPQAFLGSLAALALLFVVLGLDYRRVCRREQGRFAPQNRERIGWRGRP